ncbi:hypothetical protein MUN89_06130 [Halobacillus salinarum]|uniref:Uncharacterized protein n=1 Tax=Halobacillus salinarum TaxID=2932257 RepID=A0ABY4EM48_9BACI|nr:hypothetical protein [Halobacillus salinarum]UOQ45519.1 hypothetical protein MUN89_06130 [Halobacillus salinarum]
MAVLVVPAARAVHAVPDVLAAVAAQVVAAAVPDAVAAAVAARVAVVALDAAAVQDKKLIFQQHMMYPLYSWAPGDFSSGVLLFLTKPSWQLHTIVVGA